MGYKRRKHDLLSSPIDYSVWSVITVTFGNTISVPRDHFDTCQVLYMGMSFLTWRAFVREQVGFRCRASVLGRLSVFKASVRGLRSGEGTFPVGLHVHAIGELSAPCL